MQEEFSPLQADHHCLKEPGYCWLSSLGLLLPSLGRALSSCLPVFLREVKVDAAAEESLKVMIPSTVTTGRDSMKVKS